jgi:hypothetical protein
VTLAASDIHPRHSLPKVDSCRTGVVEVRSRLLEVLQEGFERGERSGGSVGGGDGVGEDERGERSEGWSASDLRGEKERSRGS